MIAFVLSGGGNRGAIQVGALQALSERGIQADLVCGTSAGALNGAGYCANPTPEGLRLLADIWERTRREDVWPGGPLSWAWSALTGRLGLVRYTHLLSYVEHALDDIFGRHDLVYADLQIPLRVTTVDVEARQPVEWGYPGDPLAITVTASAAMPGISEPVILNGPGVFAGTLLTDGGVTNPLPIDIAVRKGADEVYALDLSGTDTLYRPTNILEKLLADFDAIQNRLAAFGVQEAKRHNVTLHHIQFSFDVGLLNFSRAREMVSYGYLRMQEYLDNPHPLRVYQK